MTGNILCDIMVRKNIKKGAALKVNEKSALNKNAPIFLTDGAKQVMDIFDAAGVEAFFVGGAVRDSLLFKKSDDFDITTAATPDEIVSLFKDFKVVLTGEKHGTVTVVTESGPIEITTYRKDGEYTDNRHPDSVSFSSDLKEDLARRDFTINALCYHPKKGYTDLFGGLCDLESQLLKAVGDPYKRFNEDALRILRAIRFSATLGFSIEEKTSEAIFALAEQIKSVSRERIYTEFKKTLLGDFAGAVLEKYLPALSNGIEPFMTAKDKKIDFSAVDNSEKDVVLRICCFVVALGKSAEFSKELLLYLKSDRKTQKDAFFVLQGFYDGLPENSYDLKLLLNRYEKENTVKIILLHKAVGNLSNAKAETLLSKIFKIIEKRECYRIKDLAASGNDLLPLGFKEKAVGETLNTLLFAVMSGEAENEKSALIKWAEQNRKENIN